MAKVKTIPKKIRDLGLGLHSFKDVDAYTEVQVSANKRKLNRQMVRYPQIRFMAHYIHINYGQVNFGICHGTRRGGEQAQFTKALPGNPKVIGTEISDTAEQFPNTIQWDFNEANSEWAGAADFVYSNSWDHALDPYKTFKAWGESLKPGGLMILHHGSGYGPDTINEMDPFGATIEALVALVEWATSDTVKFVEVIRQENNKNNTAREIEALVFKRVEAA
jgi:hypothetical protein